MRWLQRSLLVKWLFTLLFTGLFGVGLVWFLANRTTSTGFDQLKLDQAQASFERTARRYYTDHGSWSGIDQVMQPQLTASQPAPQFILADSSDRMLICVPPYQPGDTLSGEQLSRGDAVIVNGTKVGTVLFQQGSPSLDPLEQRYLARTNQGLLLGAVGAALIALLSGFILTHHFLHPLQDLTLALRDMQHGNLQQEVPVRSYDELGELTRVFNQMSKDLTRANFLRRQMSADIAHDLRTPLTIISGHLEGLQNGTLKPNPQRFEAMAREVLRLKRLVDDLNTLSLADAGELRLSLQAVSIETLLNHAVASFQPLLDNKHLRLEVQIGPALPALSLDRQRIGQVLDNLLSNAIRHTPEGGKITLRASAGRDAVEISVQDTGEGIPPEKLPFIFERLYRVNEARSRSDGESGLGLAIVRTLVEAHNSTITAHSEIGTGTTLTIRIPTSSAVLPT